MITEFQGGEAKSGEKGMSEAALPGDKKIRDMPFVIIDGDRGSNYPKKHEFADTGYCLFLTAKNVTNDGFSFDQMQFVSEEKDQLLRKGKLQRYDIILTTRGTVGNVAYYDETVPYDNVRINSGMIIIRCDKTQLLPKYLYFILKSHIFQNQVLNFKSGSAQPQLPIRDMQSMKLPLPGIEDQQYIINQIGTLDEKIELNHKMNRTLEQIGQAVFRHYFIANPDAKKWKGGVISDLGKVVTGKTPSKARKEYYGNDVPFLKVPDMHHQSIVVNISDSLSVFGADSQSSKYIPKWSTCVSCIATVGVVSLVGKTLQTNQQINSVIPKSSEYSIFNYYILKAMSGSLQTMASGGSATPNLNKGQFERIKVILPPKNVLSKFDNSVKPLFERVDSNTQEIQSLITLRDTLLPRLILGKLKIE